METRDYSKFKFLKTNREINPHNVQKIVLSIKEHGVIPGRPVLVDGMGNIIDGQHRYLAIKELGLPVPFETIGGDTVAKTMALNANQEQWKLIDYVRSYAESGNDNYRKILKFYEKYDFSFTGCLYIGFGPSSKFNDLKKGKHYEWVEDAYLIADYLESFENIPFKNTKSFILSVINMYKKTTPEQKEHIRKHILQVPHFYNATDYKIAFENILNYKKKNNFIKL